MPATHQRPSQARREASLVCGEQLTGELQQLGAAGELVELQQLGAGDDRERLDGADRRRGRRRP